MKRKWEELERLQLAQRDTKKKIDQDYTDQFAAYTEYCNRAAKDMSHAFDRWVLENTCETYPNLCSVTYEEKKLTWQLMPSFRLVFRTVLVEPRHRAGDNRVASSFGIRSRKTGISFCTIHTFEGGESPLAMLDPTKMDTNVFCLFEELHIIHKILKEDPKFMEKAFRWLADEKERYGRYPIVEVKHCARLLIHAWRHTFPKEIVRMIVSYTIDIPKYE